MRKPSSESSDSEVTRLKMASAQVVETSVTNNSPSQDSNHPDDLFQSRYITPGFKPCSNLLMITTEGFAGFGARGGAIIQDYDNSNEQRSFSVSGVETTLKGDV